MGLFKIKKNIPYSDYQIESVCNEAIDILYYQADEVLAEETLFSILLEDDVSSVSTMAQNIEQKVNTETNAQVLQKQQGFLSQKLSAIRQWANECRDDKQKGIIQRTIALIVRVIAKIKDKIAGLFKSKPKSGTWNSVVDMIKERNKEEQNRIFSDGGPRAHQITAQRLGNGKVAIKYKQYYKE